MLDNNCKCFYEPEDDIVRLSRRPSLEHGTYYKVDSSTTQGYFRRNMTMTMMMMMIECVLDIFKPLSVFTNAVYKSFYD